MLCLRGSEGDMMDKGNVVSWERKESQHIEGNVNKLQTSVNNNVTCYKNCENSPQSGLILAVGKLDRKS